MNPLSPLTYYRRHKSSATLLVGLIGLATLGICVMVRLLDALAEQAETSERYLTRFSMVSAIGPSLDPGVVSQIRVHPGVARAIPERSLYIGTPMNTSGGFRLFGVPEADVEFLMDTCDLRLKEGRLLTARTDEIVLSEELADALELRIGDRIGRSINENYYQSIPTELVLVGILESAPRSPSTGAEKDVLTGFVSSEYLDSHELYSSGRSGLIVVAQEGHKAEVDRFLEATISSRHADVWTHRRGAELLAQGMLLFHLIFGVVDSLVAVVIALVVGAIHQIALARRVQEFGLLYAVGHSKKRLVRRLALETAAVAGVGWIGGLALSWLFFAWLDANVLPATVKLDLTNLTPIWFAAPILLAVIALVTFSIVRTFARLDAVSIIERGTLSTESSGRRPAVKRSSARPLSSWAFYLRHRRRGLALVVTMALMILGVAFPAFLFAATVDANMFHTAHLRRVSVVSPRGGTSVDPGVTAQIRTHPAVAHVMPAIRLGLTIVVPPLSQNPAMIYAVPEDDMQILINLYGVQLEEGRLPRPRSNEIVVSRPIAMNRGLHVGDEVGRPVYGDDRGIPTEMVVAGILSSPPRDSRAGDPWLVGFASYEYLRSHELYSSHPVSLLVVPTEGRKGELDAWLEESVTSEQTSVCTYGTELSEQREATLIVLLFCAGVESVIAVIAAIALAVLSYVFFTQRREEFGILHAMGHSRAWLVLRTVRETASAVAVAWLMGATVCMAGLVYMQVGVYAPIGLTLDLLNPAPWLFTLPMPLAVVAASAGLVTWMLSRLDPVSIIQRR
jgi:ABC-type lipoprotein release transport system permease subunit